MSLEEEYRNAMRPVAEEYYSLLLQQEQIENQIDEKRREIEQILSRFNRDKFDEEDAPVIITFKMQSSGERMVKGGKEMLKNLLTDEQWKQIYDEGEPKPRLTVKRRDKRSDYY